MRFKSKVRIKTRKNNRIFTLLTGYKAGISKNQDIFHYTKERMIDFLSRF